MTVMHVTPWGPILRQAGIAVKDKSYRRSPVGRDVGRFLRALRWEDKSENTNVAKAAWAVVETAMRQETEARIMDLADALDALDGDRGGGR